MRREFDYTSHQSFEAVRETTQCPFAKVAYAREVTENPESISEICDKLRQDLPRVTEEKLDVVLVNLPPQFTSTADDVGDALRQILVGLDEDCLAGVDTAEWKLHLFNQKFFVAAFWEGFPENNPRNCPEGAFLMFQPKSSFERSSLRNGPIGERTRSNIRTIFAREGKPYNHEVLTEAERFIPGVRWWEEKI